MSDKNDSQALYTKYRPQSFDDVIGQEQVVEPLKKSIEKENTSHAYIFSGGRGTGKTTIARIFARELGTHPHDIYEIDAASHTGVDTIRELLESVQTFPYDSKYKVYIFDEVHMLSKSAFNALLKTLEEPPKHVRFILATTEFEKIPDTVRSRCEVYSFKMPNQEVLEVYIKDIAKKEKLTLDKGVAELVALSGNGSFRDTLSIFQKIIRSSDDKKISQEEVSALTGVPSTSVAIDLLEKIRDKDVEGISNILNKLVEEQKSIKVFSDILLERIRAGILIRFNALKDDSDLSKEEIGRVSSLVKDSPSIFTSNTLKIFLDSYSQSGTPLIPQLPLEIACIQVIEEI